MFCLVRTDPAAAKHRGISVILLDMASGGVTTRPVKLISGESPFCETRFENVQVPKSGLLGELNGGWPISRYILGHERASIGDLGIRPGQATVHAQARERIGTENGRLRNTFLRARIAQFEMDAAAFQLTATRIREEARLGREVGAAASFLKLYGTELNKLRHELLMDIAGDDALRWHGPGNDLCRMWLRTKGNSIEGGTSEIQLNIIAKRVLGLPG
jgi:acyl-CoA dehydrogenase